jgi:hypothetical protein
MPVDGPEIKIKTATIINIIPLMRNCQIYPTLTRRLGKGLEDKLNILLMLGKDKIINNKPITRQVIAGVL